MNRIKWLFVDIDGVLTNGRKPVDESGTVLSKEYNDKDMTALALFKKKGVRVVLLSADPRISESMAERRGLEAYFTPKPTMDGENVNAKINKIKNLIGGSSEPTAYIGDDYFDIAVFKHVKHSFCPLDAPTYVRQNVGHVLNVSGGSGVIAELFWTIYGDNFDFTNNLKEI